MMTIQTDTTDRSRRCPDDGACHHGCADTDCFRVSHCGPLSGVFPGNTWPLRINAEFGVTDDRSRLYGGDGDENLFFDIAEYYEDRIEPYLDEPEIPGVTPPKTEWIVVEHSVVPPRQHMPSVEMIGEFIIEWVAENGMVDEGGWECFDNAIRSGSFKIALAQALDVLGSGVTYRMADRQLAIHTITIVDGEPFLDGEPMYHKAQETATS